MPRMHLYLAPVWQRHQSVLLITIAPDITNTGAHPVRAKRSKL